MTAMVQCKPTGGSLPVLSAYLSPHLLTIALFKLADEENSCRSVFMTTFTINTMPNGSLTRDQRSAAAYLP